MGLVKSWLAEQEQERALAADYLVTKSILKRCEAHGEIYGGGWKLEKDFWSLAMADRNRGDKGLIPWAAKMQAREFTDLLQEVCDDHLADECSYCAKLRAE